MVLPGGTVLYGWVTQKDGTTESVTFTGSVSSATTGGTAADNVCVRYYALDSAARAITISAKMIPSIVHIVLEAELYSATGTGTSATTSKIGYAQIDVPKATLTGAFTIKMTPDGVASTPFAARAIANDSMVGGCVADPYYATITEIISDANWWDNVTGIAIEGGDFSQTVATVGTQLHVWAVPSTGLPFRAPVASGSS